ncbi:MULTISPECIES: hypothetical protein [unclassified Thiocapsa]|uniref:hypothetical protein n=1 Tax=unclassified Thiocapsa TaxID=2641286 RepID=UPI0035B1AD4D
MVKLNFGCGLSSGRDWKNCDASPTLRLQCFPLVGLIAKRILKPLFPDEVRYGDVTRGLPEAWSYADLFYCSHVLEHLSLSDFWLTLKEVLGVLKPEVVFRGVLPDLEAEAIKYRSDPSAEACSTFMRATSLGLEMRPKSFVSRLRALLGNNQHLWMWDYKGLEAELASAGFVGIHRAKYNDSVHPEFATVEDPARWDGCLGFECRKAV